MAYDKFKQIVNENIAYPVESELLYKYGLTRSDIKLINEKKYMDNDYLKLTLKDEFGNPILFWNDLRLKEKFIDSQNLINNSIANQFSDFSNSEILNGFIFSEIESTL